MHLQEDKVCIWFDRLIRFFLYVLIFWLPYSPAVIETSVILGFLIFLIKRLYLFFKRETLTWADLFVCLKPQPSCLNGAIFIFLFFGLMSVVQSIVPDIALHGFVSKVLEWFIVYFLILEVFTDVKSIRVALIVFWFTAFSTVLDSYWQYFITHKDIFLGHQIGPGMRATAGFKTPNGLGAYLALFLPFSLSLFFYWKRKGLKILSLIVFFLSFGSLIIAFSRGAFLGAILGLLFYGFVFFVRERTISLKHLSVFLLIFLISSLFMGLVLNSDKVVHWLNRQGTVNGRFSVWIETLPLIHDRPLLGHGINTYMRVFQVYRKNPAVSPTFAHNCYIQMSTEMGILGLGAFAAIIYKLFESFFVRLRSRTLYSGQGVVSIGLLSGIMAFLSHSFFDNNFYSLQLSVFLWYAIGLYIVILKVEAEKSF